MLVNKEMVVCLCAFFFLKKINQQRRVSFHETSLCINAIFGIHYKSQRVHFFAHIFLFRVQELLIDSYAFRSTRGG